MIYKPVLLIVFTSYLIQSCDSEKKITQTEINISSYESYLDFNNKLDIAYTKALQPYLDCKGCWGDEAYIKRNNLLKKALMKSHEDWKQKLLDDDDFLSHVYESGTMRGGVINQNRIAQIKARIQFYELLN